MVLKYTKSYNFNLLIELLVKINKILSYKAEPTKSDILIKIASALNNFN